MRAWEMYVVGMLLLYLVVTGKILAIARSVRSG